MWLLLSQFVIELVTSSLNGKYELIELVVC